jgi:hypothetical protein
VFIIVKGFYDWYLQYSFLWHRTLVNNTQGSTSDSRNTSTHPFRLYFCAFSFILYPFI